MRGYLSVTKGSMMIGTVYAYSMLFTFLANIIYIVIIYFLWGSIYDNSETLNGITFNQTFVYLAFASSIFNLFKTWVDWRISYDIIDGRIVVDLIKPLDFQLLALSQTLGFMMFNALVITIPSMFVVFVVLGGTIPLGINLLFFPISLVMAYLLSFTLDYMTGLTSFYTESLWGISMTKEVIVLLLSGALIPLQFFPESLQRILYVLPFQAIYHSPLQIITAPDLRLPDYLEILGVQALWVVALVIVSRLFYAQAVKAVTINGG